MKRFFSLLIAITTSLCLLSSCDLDLVDDYTISNKISISLQIRESQEEGKAVAEQIMAYFEAIPDFNKAVKFHGSYYDASMKAVEQFQLFYPKMNEEEILDLLGEGDMVQYIVYLTGKKINEPSAVETWIGPQIDIDIE